MARMTRHIAYDVRGSAIAVRNRAAPEVRRRARQRSSTRSWRRVKEHGMEQKPVKSTDASARRKLLRSKVHLGLAAFGTLAAVVGIGVVIKGGLYFDRTKVLVGVGIIIVSTVLYVSMLFIESDE
jgi:hypothetical protein